MITSTLSFKRIQFPVGEPHITLQDVVWENQNIAIDWEFENISELMDVLLLADAIRSAGGHLYFLRMPYVPFGRQDRVASAGEAFSLRVFADIINHCGFERVYVDDPHSDVTGALIDNLHVRTQDEIFGSTLQEFQDYWLISPDGGALKKIYKLAGLHGNLGVIECSKIRNVQTGEITGTKVHHGPLEGKACVIVDDICDGGRTFTEIAKELKKLGAGSITLMVTHGFFTKGLGVFDGLIDNIYTRKGKVK